MNGARAETGVPLMSVLGEIQPFAARVAIVRFWPL